MASLLGNKRKSRAENTVVDLATSEMGEKTPPADVVVDSERVEHDMSRVTRANRCPVDFSIPFFKGAVARPSSYTTADGRSLGNGLGAPPRTTAATGQVVLQFNGDLFRLSERPVRHGHGHQYIIKLSETLGMDCGPAYLAGRDPASAANTAVHLVPPTGTALTSRHNNCHVALDFTVPLRPRLYLYFIRPLKYDATNWTELLWPYGANYIHAAFPPNEETQAFFLLAPAAATSTPAGSVAAKKPRLTDIGSPPSASSSSSAKGSPSHTPRKADLPGSGEERTEKRQKKA